MNYIKIKYILLLSCTALNIILADDNKQGFMLNFFIPLEVEISLDFLKTEIENYKDELKNDWNSPRSQSIIKKAEHIAQSAPTNFQDDVTQKIINFFDAIDIKISFKPIHLTIINDEIEARNHFEDLNNQISLIQQKKDLLTKRIKEQKKLNAQNAKKNKKTIVPIKFKPKKIKGARRSMKKLQKYRDDKRKRELARRKELLDYLNSRRKQTQEKEQEDNERNIHAEILKKEPIQRPIAEPIIQRKKIQPAHKPIPKNIHLSKKTVPQEHLYPHELFPIQANLN